MAGIPGYTVQDAIDDAREWTRGQTFSEGSRGWRVCCSVLADRVEELEKMLSNGATIGCAIVRVSTDEAEYDDVCSELIWEDFCDSPNAAWRTMLLNPHNV